MQEGTIYAGTGLQPVPERFCLEVRAQKLNERGCKPRPAW